MSLQTVDKGLFALVHIQEQVTQDDWFDVGQVLLWMGSLITPVSLSVQSCCAQEVFVSP